MLINIILWQTRRRPKWTDRSWSIYGKRSSTCTEFRLDIACNLPWHNYIFLCLYSRALWNKFYEPSSCACIVLAAGGKPSTMLPPGCLVEQAHTKFLHHGVRSKTLSGHNFSTSVCTATGLCMRQGVPIPHSTFELYPPTLVECVWTVQVFEIKESSISSSHRPLISTKSEDLIVPQVL